MVSYQILMEPSLNNVEVNKNGQMIGVNYLLIFFETLPKLSDADLLVDYVKGLFDIHILTAIPKRGQYDGARVQKYKWCLNHLKIYPSKIHVCFWEEKQYFAVEENLSPNLLIDDNVNNIEAFRAKGGIAIHHTSAENSIKELQQLGF